MLILILWSYKNFFGSCTTSLREVAPPLSEKLNHLPLGGCTTSKKKSFVSDKERLIVKTYGNEKISSRCGLRMLGHCKRITARIMGNTKSYSRLGLMSIWKRYLKFMISKVLYFMMNTCRIFATPERKTHLLMIKENLPWRNIMEMKILIYVEKFQWFFML